MKRWICVASVLLFLAGASTAQEFRGTILGRVLDGQGAAIPGAVVAIKNTATGVATTVQSNEVGDYYAPFLVPGTYEMNVEHTGFKAYKTAGIVISMTDRVRLDVRLEVGSQTESITVSDVAPLLDMTSGARGGLVSQTMLADLPMSGHTSLMLVRLMPGVSGGARTFARTYDTGTVIDFSM
ncbi:MAG: carboxypeptidase-like regulatory domain-containing protein, partial [Candidatus Solibacter sp.]|nr:carboxypeptidase-like regulatory domain-containing protein [Candidatus Solibacter sp.]